MNFCPQCHTDNPPGVMTCRLCGAIMVSWGSMVSPAPVAEAAPRAKVTLRVVRADGGPELTYTLKKDEAVAGSGGDVLLTEDPFVARTQAKFVLKGGAITVEDIGGGCGVFLRLRSETALARGQEVRCGRQRLVFEPIPAAPGTTPRLWGSPDPGYRLRLVQMLEGGRRGDAWPLKEGENLVGREAGDITFPGDGFVSGRHAVLTVNGDAVSVRDVGSSNGTFVRLVAPAPLQNADQLLIGRELIKIEMA